MGVIDTQLSEFVTMPGLPSPSHTHGELVGDLFDCYYYYSSSSSPEFWCLFVCHLFRWAGVWVVGGGWCDTRL